MSKYGFREREEYLHDSGVKIVVLTPKDTDPAVVRAGLLEVTERYYTPNGGRPTQSLTAGAREVDIAKPHWRYPKQVRKPSKAEQMERHAAEMRARPEAIRSAKLRAAAKQQHERRAELRRLGGAQA